MPSRYGHHRSIRSNSASAARGSTTPHTAFIALDARALIDAEESANTDCPEARMAGENPKNNNKNNKLR
jgi:hypothetical protein